MEQKIIITNSAQEINGKIENGWRVVSTTAQIMVGGEGFIPRGQFCFVLEKK